MKWKWRKIWRAVASESSVLWSMTAPKIEWTCWTKQRHPTSQLNYVIFTANREQNGININCFIFSAKLITFRWKVRDVKIFFSLIRRVTFIFLEKSRIHNLLLLCCFSLSFILFKLFYNFFFSFYHLLMRCLSIWRRK